SPVGRSPSMRASKAWSGMACASPSPSSSGASRWCATRTRWIAARSTAGSRSRIPGSTTRATSCSGALPLPRWSTSSSISGPSAYRFTRESVHRVVREWTEAIERDFSHPCVMAWVPINESWGVPNLPDSAPERHYVQSLYYLTRTLDPTRPVIGNDGWESVATDIVGIHDYDHDAHRLQRQYHGDREVPRIFRRERPGGRLLVLGGDTHAELPIVLSEFGGIAM